MFILNLYFNVITQKKIVFCDIEGPSIQDSKCTIVVSNTLGQGLELIKFWKLMVESTLRDSS